MKDSSPPAKLNSSTLSLWQQMITFGVGTEADLLVTHPLDKVAKEKQNQKIIENSKSVIAERSSFIALKPTSENLKKTLTLNELYKGVSWSAANKFLSRTLRYTTQDTLQKGLQKNLASITPSSFNNQQRKTFFGMLSGVASSVLETAVLYPIDTIKTRSELGEGKKFKNLYKGLPTSVFRGALSAGVFFGSYNYFANSDKKNDTANNMSATVKASELMTVVTNPIEVLKTRVQSTRTKKNMFEVAKDAIKTEGVQAFAKGLVPRIALAPLKVAFPFFVFNQLKTCFEKQNENQVKQHVALSNS